MAAQSGCSSCCLNHIHHRPLSECVFHSLIVPTSPNELNTLLLCCVQSRMLRSLDVDLHQLHVHFFIASATISTQSHLYVIAHFLWEVPVKPRQPSLVAAAIVWTTSITVPQWVIKSNSLVVLPSTGDSRFTIVILSNKHWGKHLDLEVWHRGSCIFHLHNCHHQRVQLHMSIDVDEGSRM